MLDKPNLQGLCPLTPSGLCPEPSKGASPFANPFYRSPLGRRKKPCFSLFDNSFLGSSRVKGKGFARMKKFLLNARSSLQNFFHSPLTLQSNHPDNFRAVWGCSVGVLPLAAGSPHAPHSWQGVWGGIPPPSVTS